MESQQRKRPSPNTSLADTPSPRASKPIPQTGQAMPRLWRRDSTAKWYGKAWYVARQSTQLHTQSHSQGNDKARRETAILGVYPKCDGASLSGIHAVLEGFDGASPSGVISQLFYRVLEPKRATVAVGLVGWSGVRGCICSHWFSPLSRGSEPAFKAA